MVSDKSAGVLARRVLKVSSVGSQFNLKPRSWKTPGCFRMALKVWNRLGPTNHAPPLCQPIDNPGKSGLPPRTWQRPGRAWLKGENSMMPTRITAVLIRLAGGVLRGSRQFANRGRPNEQGENETTSSLDHLSKQSPGAPRSEYLRRISRSRLDRQIGP
jgi:hypothetical protein